MTAPPELRLRLGKAARLRTTRPAVIIAVVLLLTLVGLALLCLAVGSLSFSFTEVMAGLLRHTDERTVAVIWNIRLPRIVTAIAVGMSLGAAGCVFQSMSRNALGSPDIIGFTTGAATGAVVAIVLVGASHAVVSLSAVGAGLLTAAAVYGLARHQGITGTHRLILVGVGVSAMLSALNTLILAKGHIDLAIKARLWLSGSLVARQWSDAVPALIGLALIIPLLVILAQPLTMMEMGDDQARQLGVHPERVRIAVMVGGVTLTALAVAGAGPIAFIALAAPHIVRTTIHATHVPVLTSALVGAVLLLSADLLSTTLPVPIALPVGLVTGTIGGVYLLWVLVTETQR